MSMQLKLKRGKGVLSKDNHTPFAPSTIHVSRLSTHNGNKMVWKSPVPYAPSSVIEALMDKHVTEVQVIDGDNRQFTLTITRT